MLVHKLRLQRGWSQEQLADLSGLSVRTIQRIERGGSASVESLKALAAVFEVDFQQLRQEVDMSPAPLPPDPAAAGGPVPADAASAAPHASPPADANPGQAALPTDEALVLAQVRRIRGFYEHLARYAFIVGGLAVLNAIQYVFHGHTYWWVLWVAAGWGIGLLAHGLRAFGRGPLFLGADWERRQVEKRLKRSL
ncbi:MAG: 2TM domain-containing protein [Burkholderiales bacterium]|jgi:transcriptional regulator with XRE-family HTH domain